MLGLIRHIWFRWAFRSVQQNVALTNEESVKITRSFPPSHDHNANYICTVVDDNQINVKTVRWKADYGNRAELPWNLVVVAKLF
jgi:hypothetical protein